MKKLAFVALTLVALTAFTARAAEELVLTAERIEFRQDKNGNEYAFLVFGAQPRKSPGGLVYSEQLTGTIPSWEKEALAQAKKIKPGTKVILVADKRSWSGNEVLRIRAITAAGQVKPAALK